MAINRNIIDGKNVGEVMNPGYNDANGAINNGGNIIDGADGSDDIIVGNGGGDTINAGLGNDIVYGDGGQGDIATQGTFQAGEPLMQYVHQVNLDVLGYQSPPIVTTLANGQVAYVWINDGASDDRLSMIPQMRIANADGSWATHQAPLDALWAVDGYDAYDWDNMSVDLLADGNLMISYVRNTAEVALNEPVFSIIDPSHLCTPEQYVVVNEWIQRDDPHGFESPPMTTVLDNGNVLFVWSEQATSDDNLHMTLQGRIYDPETQSFTTPRGFWVGDVAVDGSNHADVENMDIVQLTNGNVVVTYARSNAEFGHNKPVYTILDRDGNTVTPTFELEGQDNGPQHTPWDSPAQIVALADGNWMATWVNDGYSDDITTMSFEGRIFNAEGQPLTGDILLSNFVVDGWNHYDIPNFTIDTIGADRVVVSFVNGTIVGDAYGGDKAHFSIFDVSNPENPEPVVIDAPIQVRPDHPYSGPALIEALGDSGAFVAVYGDGNAAYGGHYGLDYRIFDADGRPLSDEIEITISNQAIAVSGKDHFDWDNIDIEYNPMNDTFTVNWVGANDGHGTGVFTSGPIAGVYGGPVDFDPNAFGDDIINGGEGADTLFGQAGNDTFVVANAAEGAGDVIVGGNGPNQTTDNDTLDLRGAGAVTIDAVADVNDAGAQAGTVTFKNGSTLAFSQIETVLQDAVVVNQGPNAIDDNLGEQSSNAPVVISQAELFGNDFDPEGDAYTGIAIGNAQNGTVAFDGTNVIFTPNAGYEGPAAFTYTIQENGTGKQDTATVNLTIVNDAVPALTLTPSANTPVDTNGLPVVTEDGPSIEVLVTRTGPFDQALLVALGSGDPTEAVVPGSVIIPAGQASTLVTVTPVDDTVIDGPRIATISAAAPSFTPALLPVSVLDNDTGVGTNQGPVAIDDDIATQAANTAVVISPAELLGNDYDPEGDAFTGVALGNAQNGTVVFDGTNVIFTPDADYTGPASFTYTIQENGTGKQDTAKVNLNFAQPTGNNNATNGDDNLTGTNGDDVIDGLAGDDNISSGNGNDIVVGGQGNDFISAGNGDDTVVGGQGNDVMSGGNGSDTFVWTYDDIQAAGTEVDVISVDSNDTLDLSDLLIGEENVAAGSVAEALDNYLDFGVNAAGDTVINVSAEGSFANGVDQAIVLQGVDITAGDTLSDVQVLNTLLANNNIITDA